MSNAYESIKKGLGEAIEHAKGKKLKAIVHEFTPIDVKNVRSNVGMSQSEFASAFGISVSTLRHWERGDRTPHGPALVLLNVVAKEPKAVLRALGSNSNKTLKFARDARRTRKKTRAA
ncbi:MAG: helix-turn-helix domain-containing protein [Gammaproteobacteria bacterium]|nr:helix-turn-helix domain-containing protein [Gammaproteobacteria bacterium]